MYINIYIQKTMKENGLTDKERLRKLDILTENLPSINPLKETGDGFNELDVTNGFGFLFNLLNNLEIAVSKFIICKGSILDKHYHGEREWVIVYKGKLKFTRFNLDDTTEEEIIGVGEFTVFEKNDVHTVTALLDTEAIAITIPASMGFPK